MGHIPRQQFLDAIHRMIGDVLEYLVLVAMRVDVIKFATFRETINDCCALTTSVESE
jgi:hypothetical protein